MKKILFFTFFVISFPQLMLPSFAMFEDENKEVASSYVSIKGLEPINVIEALWNNAIIIPKDKQNEQSSITVLTEEFPEAEVTKKLNEGTWFDYFLGGRYFSDLSSRPLYIFLCGKSFHSYMYNKSYGDGRAERVIRRLRERGLVNSMESLSLIGLPPEVLVHIFSYLSFKELSQVALASSRLHAATGIAPLWKEMSFKLGLVDESFANPNLNYKVMVVAAFDPAFIDSIFHEICLSVPGLLFRSGKKIMEIHSLIRLCRLGDKRALFNVARDVLAISINLNNEKHKELTETVRELDDSFVAKGDSRAIKRKISGPVYGEDDYGYNPAVARELNEALIAQGDKDAIKRKIWGLVYGRDGYEINLEAARELNEALVAQADSEAIQRKLTWLSRDSETSWKNYVNCLEMALGFTDPLEIVSESCEKAYFDFLKFYSQRIKQLRSEP